MEPSLVVAVDATDATDASDASEATGERATTPSPGAAVPGFAWVRAVIAGVVTLLVIGLPTDIIANPLFGRAVPVRWWEYPVLGATAILTAMWFGIQTARGREDSPAPALGGATIAMFAVACPVCNKIVVASIGMTGALGVWAPLQPLLAVFGLVTLVAAVAMRWRRRDCGPTCAIPAQRRG